MRIAASINMSDWNSKDRVESYFKKTSSNFQIRPREPLNVMWMLVWEFLDSLSVKPSMDPPCSLIGYLKGKDEDLCAHLLQWIILS